MFDVRARTALCDCAFGNAATPFTWFQTRTTRVISPTPLPQGEFYACALSNIYTFGPTFRAEYSFTARHLAEFWMIEPEMAFCDLKDDMQCAEDYVRYCCKWVGVRAGGVGRGWHLLSSKARQELKATALVGISVMKSYFYSPWRTDLPWASRRAHGLLIINF